MARRRVLIVGGGLSGYAVARSLEAHLAPAEREAMKITLIAREPALALTPLLAQVASGRLSADEAQAPIAPSLRAAQLVLGEVESIDPSARTVKLSGAQVKKGLVEAEMGFDELVVCLGAEPCFHEVTGAADHALPLRSAPDALRLRGRLLELLEAASAEDSPRRRRSLCTVVVAGGNEAACQIAAELSWALRAWAGVFPRLEPGDGRVVLVAEKLLPALSSKLSLQARALLEQAGVEVRVGAKLAQIADDHVLVRPGAGQDERLDARVVVWADRAQLPACLGPLLGAERAPMPVEATLESTGREGIWAAGECAAVELAGAAQGPSAELSWRSAEVIARNLVARLRGKPLEPLRAAKLRLVACGPGRAAGEVGGVVLPSGIASALWSLRWLSRVPGGQRARLSAQLALSSLSPSPPPSLRLASPKAPLYLTPLPPPTLPLPPSPWAPTNGAASAFSPVLPAPQAPLPQAPLPQAPLPQLPPPQPPPPPRSRPVPSTEPMSTLRMGDSADRTLKDPPR